MKIAVSSTGKTLDSMVDPRLGRCSYFLIIDSATKDWQVLENPGITAAGGAGIQAAQALVNAGVEIVITGNLGPNAWEVLQGAEIKLYKVNNLTIEKALQALAEEKLETISSAGPSHAGMGHRNG